jgi:hypothetical protein
MPAVAQRPGRKGHVGAVGREQQRAAGEDVDQRARRGRGRVSGAVFGFAGRWGRQRAGPEEREGVGGVEMREHVAQAGL